MRLSSDLPPAGFTRAEPSPPGRPRPFRSPRPFVAVVLVLGAGLALGVGHGTTRPTPGGTLTEGAATPAATRPPPSGRAPSPGRAAPEPGDVSSGTLPATRSRPSRRGHAVPSRGRLPPRSRPDPRPRATPRDGTAVPSWIAAECRRRFPDDPRRRSACAAALTDAFGS
ncbi:MULTISPECIES: hypothetical protein [unclassified Spirillospora]|uniref:hypothetical protein n=1 Tax=unclassified Spirillospora TaxID=2642701 RepID=UPI0037162F7E